MNLCQMHCPLQTPKNQTLVIMKLHRRGIKNRPWIKPNRGGSGGGPVKGRHTLASSPGNDIHRELVSKPYTQPILTTRDIRRLPPVINWAFSFTHIRVYAWMCIFDILTRPSYILSIYYTVQTTILHLQATVLTLLVVNPWSQTAILEVHWPV